jgi:hypothetical protein
MSELDKGNPLNANAARWLMSNRTNGHWYSTQETAWTLIGLTNWMLASGELNADYSYAVTFNGIRWGGQANRYAGTNEPMALTSPRCSKKRTAWRSPGRRT